MRQLEWMPTRRPERRGRAGLKRLDRTQHRMRDRAAHLWRRAGDADPGRTIRKAVDRTPKRSASAPVRALRATAAIGAGGAAGAGAMYLLDPTAGRRRRAMARDRAVAVGRRGVRRVGRVWRRAGAEVYGLSRRVTHPHLRERPAPSDAALADRVRSIAFRGPDLPDGRVNVNVEDGVVVLRGQLDRPEQIRELEAAVRKVEGVHDVESLLHLPDTPAPNKQDARGPR